MQKILAMLVSAVFGKIIEAVTQYFEMRAEMAKNKREAEARVKEIMQVKDATERAKQMKTFLGGKTNV